MTSTEVVQLLVALRRDLRIATLTRLALIGLFAFGLVAAAAATDERLRLTWLWTVTMVAAIIWALLTIASTKQIRAANQASAHLASGRLDLAESQLRTALRIFSIYSPAKLLACHNLAVLAHGRGEFIAAAELCTGVLRQARRLGGSARRTTRMLLADCKLSLNDVVAANAALQGLDVMDERMPLSERLMLLPIRVRCDVTAGSHEVAVQQLREKVRLAELLESPRAALVHALLARACRCLGRPAEAEFLHARACLLHDLADLYEQVPLLKEP